ncbi:methyl-accepting chemotaxis protein, partial [Ligilactobacillus sp. WC1T17]
MVISVVLALSFLHGLIGVREGTILSALLTGRMVVFTEPYKDIATGKMVVTATYAFKAQNGRTMVFATDMSFSSIEKTISKLKIGTTGRVVFVTTKGQVVATTGADKSSIKQGTNISNTALFKAVKKASAKKGTIHLAGTSKITDAYYFKPGRYYTYSYVQKSDLSRELRIVALNAGLIALVVAIFAAILAAAVSGVFKRLMDTILGYFKEAEGGNLKPVDPAEVKADGFLDRTAKLLYTPRADGTEFNRLIYAYNDVIAGVGDLVTSVKRQSNEVAEKSDSLFELSKQTNKATEEVTQTINGIAEVTSSQAQETQESVSRL